MLKEGGSEKPSIPLAIWNMNPSFILVFLGVPSSTLMARRGGGEEEEEQDIRQIIISSHSSELFPYLLRLLQAVHSPRAEDTLQHFARPRMREYHFKLLRFSSCNIPGSSGCAKSDYSHRSCAKSRGRIKLCQIQLKYRQLFARLRDPSPVIRLAVQIEK
jgi:hypothetical protein